MIRLWALVLQSWSAGLWGSLLVQRPPETQRPVPRGISHSFTVTLNTPRLWPVKYSLLIRAAAIKEQISCIVCRGCTLVSPVSLMDWLPRPSVQGRFLPLRYHREVLGSVSPWSYFIQIICLQCCFFQSSNEPPPFFYMVDNHALSFGTTLPIKSLPN